MTTAKENMKILTDQRDKLLAEMEAMKHKIEGLNLAISLLDGGEGGLKAVSRRSGVKSYILGLLQEVGAEGLNAQKAVEMAAQRGDKIDRASVSSLLSRFKLDKTITYDGTLYRLKEFSPGNESSPTEEVGQVVKGVFR
ncbi:MAG: hypothetical protein Q8L22_09775 [Reyranella sp.]|nr:hypothetical protein [Reyranella sp.]